MKLPSPQPSPGLGEGVFAPKNFCLTLARFAGEGRVRDSSTQPRNLSREHGKATKVLKIYGVNFADFACFVVVTASYSLITARALYFKILRANSPAGSRHSLMTSSPKKRTFSNSSGVVTSLAAGVLSWANHLVSTSKRRVGWVKALP